jgi:hypothetical protein
MSVSSAGYGVTLNYYGTSTKQGFFKTVSDTSLSYGYSTLTNIQNSFCAGIGQDPDEHASGTGIGDNWTDYTRFPFPGQVTTCTSEGDNDDSIDVWSIGAGIQSITCIDGTIIPTFDDGFLNRWTDMAASAVDVDDYVFTATTTQANTNGGSVRVVLASTDHGGVSAQYYQPQFDSVDYYGVTGVDTDTYCIFVAWDAGNTHI